MNEGMHLSRQEVEINKFCRFVNVVVGIFVEMVTINMLFMFALFLAKYGNSYQGIILSRIYNCTKPGNRPIDNATTAHFTLHISILQPHKL